MLITDIFLKKNLYFRVQSFLCLVTHTNVNTSMKLVSPFYPIDAKTPIFCNQFGILEFWNLQLNPYSRKRSKGVTYIFEYVFYVN